LSSADFGFKDIILKKSMRSITNPEKINNSPTISRIMCVWENIIMKCASVNTKIPKNTNMELIDLDFL
jgi:hypothetical protein